MKELPIGESSFENIIMNNMIYVDKTKILYELINKGARRCFFARPRRFGKSLTCSTLEAIFTGRKDLFKNLWIGQSDYVFKSHPVIFFDFNEISHETPEILEHSLISTLDAHAEKYAINLESRGLIAKLAELIVKLGQTYGPVVVIVDEYDKPIADQIDNAELSERFQQELRYFYATFKAHDIDANLLLLFMTGIYNVSNVGLLPDVNNLYNLSADSRAAALVGYTDQEVDHYFKEHIQTFADTRKENYDQTRQLLKSWYNGYRFSPANITVYNPFSLHNCLANRLLANYWFSSGTTNFLMKFIQKNPLIASDIETIEGSFFAASNLEKFTPDAYYQKYRTLLLQTGYLTFISDYDTERCGYTIGYPNEEVRYSMNEQIMDFVRDITSIQFGEFKELNEKQTI
jgi:hypothetical protein